MSLSIKTNIGALTVLNNLDATDNALQTSITRLSSGLRINSAADDPAGLIASETMKAQLAGMTQAVANTQDAINMSKTADGAMSQIQALLLNIRSLAVSSANTAVADASTLQANQTQIQSTIESIDEIASSTQFGDKQLLNGTAGVQANVTDPTDVNAMFVGGTFGGVAVQSGPITVQVTTPATEAVITLTKTFASSTSIVGTSGNLVINGYSFQSTGNETLQTLVGGINQESSQTGVSAQIVSVGGGNYGVQLSQTAYGAQFSIDYFDPNNILDGAASATSTGSDAVANVTLTTSQGVKTVPFTGGQGPQTTGLQLTDPYGNSLTLSDSGNSGLTSPTQVGALTVGSVQFQVGAFAGQSVSYAMPTVFATDLGTGVVPGESIATLDVTSQSGANDAIDVIDAAITQLAQQRGQLGAFQSDFLQSNQSSLNIASENLTSSISSITDANMAQEITNLTQTQVLQQSGIAVLAQANQTPTQILSLLKSL